MPPRTQLSTPELGKAIRDARIALGLSIEEAAARSGVGAKTWGRYESGASLRQDKVRAVCRTLRWSGLDDSDGSIDSSIRAVDDQHEAWSAALVEAFGEACATVFASGTDQVLDNLNDELTQLCQQPSGTHVGQLPHSWIKDLLPAQFLPRYDYEFLYTLRGAVLSLRERFHESTVAYTVLEEIALYLIFSVGATHMGTSEPWPQWLEEILGDLEVEYYLYNPAEVVQPGFAYHFDHWSEEQFWIEESDSDDTQSEELPE